MTELRTKLLEQGYYVATVFSPNEVQKIRARLLEVFSCVTVANGGGPILGDSDVVRLYEENKPLWISAVDQLPYLPEIIGRSDDPRLLGLAQEAGIKLPALSGFGVSILANMPADDERLYQPHQDITYIPGSLNGITIWIPLQDSPHALGPLEVVPGSHTLGLLKTNDAKDVKRARLSQPYPDESFLAVPIDQGQCIVFSKFLVHRSGKNRSNGARFSLQFRYNDLSSPEYCRRHLSFERLDVENPEMQYSIDA